MKYTTKQAAEYLNISKTYLRNMRHLQHTYDGPEYQKDKHPRGIACYYTKESLDMWLKNHTLKSKKAA